MTRPHPRRGRHLGLAHTPSRPVHAAPAPTPTVEEREELLYGAAPVPPRPDLLTGAVRAELLADDWRTEFRAAAAEVDPLEAEEIMAEGATEQGDEYDLCADIGHSPTMEGRCAVCGTTIPDPVESDGDPVGTVGEEWAEVEQASADDFDHDAPPAPAEEEVPLAAVLAHHAEMIAEGPLQTAAGEVRDWVSKHDPRSLEHLVRARIRQPVPVQDRLWPRGSILDQGTTPPLSPRDASGCTGFATVAAVNALRPSLGLGRDDALDLYLEAQRTDHVPGEDYPGTSVLAAMKAAQRRGWIDAYLWARGTRDVAQAVLQVGPVVLGIPWLSDMKVSPAGILTPAGERGGLGHAIACIGLVRKVDDWDGPYFVLQQSQGEDVGDGGLLYLHHADLALLLRGIGEAAVPVIGP